ncbi:MAG: DUF1318 domain-containing protein [Lysobacterales bacterium]|nr:MAG: DUF1318 domain-containing protein [Xanthomonadales bacterium]
MKKWNVAVLLGAAVVLAACVTINVYFPTAAAEKAAEKFVDDVLAEPQDEGSLFDPWRGPGDVVRLAAQGVLDFFVPSAQAQQQQAEIEINTPQINAIKARMADRQRQSLAALFDAGAIGFTADGLVTIRDWAAVPLNERRSIESVVADENRDRSAVYLEIAIANWHPEWDEQIQQTFSKEWVQKARPGWYYQDASGAWQQK